MEDNNTSYTVLTSAASPDAEAVNLGKLSRKERGSSFGYNIVVITIYHSSRCMIVIKWNNLSVLLENLWWW